MRLPFSRLAVTAGVLSAATALSPKEIPPDTPVSSLLSTAQVHLAKRETSEALVYYDAAIAKDPKNYLTFFKRATAFLSIGRSSQATEDFNRVLALKPGFHGAHVQLAKIKSRAADWAGAQADYIAAGKTSDSPELVELNLAEEAAKAAAEAAMRRSWDECISNAGTAIAVASRSLKLREMRSNCRFSRGDIEEGISDLQHVLYLNPGDTTPHIVISATKSYALGDLDNGLEQIRKCLHSDPDSKTCKTFHKRGKAVQKALNKATGQLKKGQPTTAGRTIVGTEEEPGLISMIEEHIKELRESGSIPEKAGSKLLVKIVDMACQAYSESSHKQAEKYCNEALELNAESFWGLMFRARSLLKKEEYEAAIKTLENANELHPEMQEKISPVMKKARIALKRSKTKDYYKVLGVANDADERQIKSAYRKASKKYHPDKAHKQGFSKEEAEKKMASINEAYEVLSNPELRARFDHGDDPNSQESNSPFQGNPFGGGDGHHFMFQQGGQHFKFNFPGGGPFGF